MLKIIDIEIIKNELLETNNSRLNFPRNISFKFTQNYKEIVSQIKTTEISAECILFNSIKSVNETKEFSDIDYWEDNFEMEKIKDYWFFGANGQGDLWILNKNDNVFFYDHNNGEISEENLIDLELNFDKWLQFAFLNKQLEDIDIKGNLNENFKNIYKSKLSELSSGLSKKYPFEI